jgi:hypothetical protein
MTGPELRRRERIFALASVMTLTVMFELSFLALTTTPSIGPSSALATVPASATAVCAMAGDP